jgi:hypothetical protein
MVSVCVSAPQQKYTEFGCSKQAPQLSPGRSACFVRFHYDISQKMEKRNQFIQTPLS